MLKKEFLLEWRSKASLGSLLVHSLATIFFIYMIFNGDINFITWLALFWVINLFSVIQITARTFQKDANEHFYYLKQLASAHQIILSKIIYNTIFITLMSFIVFLFMQLFFSQQVTYLGIFALTIFLASLGFSALFSLLSGISAKTQNMVLLAVLGLPIILPLILIISKLSALADFYTTINDIYIFLSAAVLLDITILILAIILFPYLWKD
ncbi:MAG: ABC transporter permease [Chitinophagales bacterium]